MYHRQFNYFKNKWIFGYLFLLTGCCISMLRCQQVENLNPPSSLETSLEKSLETPYFCMEGWPKCNWWEIFNSTELNQLIEIALVQNPSLYEAQSRVEYVWQQANIVRSRLFPFVGF